MAFKRNKKTTRKQQKPAKKGNNPLPLAVIGGAAGTASVASALPSYYRSAKSAYGDARRAGGQFLSRLRNPEEGIISTSLGHIGFTSEGLEEYVRDGYLYHAYANGPVFEDGYRSGTPIAQLEEVAAENPAKFDRCVRAVEESARRSGRPANAYAICTAAGTRNPSKILNAVTHDKEDAAQIARDLRNMGAKNVQIKLVKGVYQIWTASPTRRNPEDAANALYEEFHGTPPTETLEIIEEERIHSHLAGLADVIQIIVRLDAGSRKGAQATILAPDPDTSRQEDIVRLTSNESGNQLYFVGGDQALDLSSLGFRDSFTVKHDGESYDATDIKDLMVIGEVQKLTYRTQKKFDEFEVVDYFHKLGEDTKSRPTLLYDTMNSRMKLAGGEYTIHWRGIVN